MRSRIVQALKVLASHGAIDRFIPLRTTDLADWLEVSQQTASNRLLELIDSGFVERRWSVGVNQVMLTKKGINLLSKEYEELKTIFETLESQMVFIGTTQEGIGEGKYYILQDGYQVQFEDKLGFKPEHGTFNIQLTPKDIPRLARLKEKDGIPIEGFESEGRTFGKGKCFRARIGLIDCAIMVPNRSHYEDILEVIADSHLRKNLGLSNGDRVEITIFF